MKKNAIDNTRMQRLSHATVEQSREGIFWIDTEARIYRANRAACELLGYTQDELQTMTIGDIDNTAEMQRIRDYLHQREHLGRFTLDSRFVSRDGREFPVEITNNFITFDDMRLSCTFFHDITDRKQSEEQLNTALAELEELKNRLEAENVYLQEEIKGAHNFEEIIGCTPVMRHMLAQVELVAATDANVLIQGETGTGKELVARAIHHLSPRHEHALVKVNCAALPAELIESELFGHEKGAFTGALNRRAGRFELADGGTIFLDEIGDLPHPLQAKLLRVLQEGEFERLGDPTPRRVNVRVIAATNRDLHSLVQERAFRSDLFYRLNVFPITCPPLRERRGDIELLVRHFISRLNPRLGRQIISIPRPVLDALERYDWPGNVRELINIIERAMIMSPGKQLQLDHILLPTTEGEPGEDLTLATFEREHLLRILTMTGWRIRGSRGAAQLLGLKPTTLEARMQRLDIRRPV